MKHRNKGGGKQKHNYNKEYRKKLQQCPHPEEKAKDEIIQMSDEEKDIDEQIRQFEHVYGPHVHTPFVGLPAKLMNSRWPIE